MKPRGCGPQKPVCQSWAEWRKGNGVVHVGALAPSEDSGAGSPQFLPGRIDGRVRKMLGKSRVSGQGENPLCRALLSQPTSLARQISSMTTLLRIQGDGKLKERGVETVRGTRSGLYFSSLGLLHALRRLAPSETEWSQTQVEPSRLQLVTADAHCTSTDGLYQDDRNYELHSWRFAHIRL
jgi:hypothetical protein